MVYLCNCMSNLWACLTVGANMIFAKMLEVYTPLKGKY